MFCGRKSLGAARTHHAAHLDYLQAIKFTSGSTGMPKGVIHSYRVFNACIASMILSFEFDAADWHRIVAPTTHGANTLHMPIFSVGGTQLFTHNSRPATVHAPPTLL